MKVKNFLFHRVNDNPDPFWPAMLTSQFKSILSQIKKSYHVISTDELLHLKKHHGGKTLATISFDDGYKDNIEYAAPILQHYKMPATFYVVTNCIDNNVPTWTYDIDYRTYFTKNTIDLSSCNLPESLLHKQRDKKTSTVQFTGALKAYLKKIDFNKVLEIVKTIEEQTQDIDMPKLMMHWDDIMQLYKSNFVIGSHSHTHPMLNNITNENIVRAELVISKSRIEEKINSHISSIAFPVGGYNETVKTLSAEEGYKYAMAVEQKSHGENIDVFAIPRIELYNEPRWKTFLRMNEVMQRTKKIVRHG
ncbi:MAG: polysaccharide deacetylase family protein [Bacteroidetes bacterium]|nr:polysaccharide deacetylase family protein [Bacteroidota bacterium]